MDACIRRIRSSIKFNHSCKILCNTQIFPYVLNTIQTFTYHSESCLAFHRPVSSKTPIVSDKDNLCVDTMSYYQQPSYSSTSNTGGTPQNLQFYQSNYGSGTVSGHTTPFQAQGYGQQGGYGYSGGGPGSQGYGAPPGAGGYGAYGVSGSMGTQGGLRTGWLAALSPEGYEGEPPLLEELGVNFGHIKMKVSSRKPKKIRCGAICEIEVELGWHLWRPSFTRERLQRR